MADIYGGISMEYPITIALIRTVLFEEDVVSADFYYSFLLNGLYTPQDKRCPNILLMPVIYHLFC